MKIIWTQIFQQTIKQKRGKCDSSKEMSPFSPWALRLQFQGVNLSNTGAFASTGLQELGANLNLKDLNTILNDSDTYLLQLDNSFDHLDSPMIKAKIARKNFDSTRLEIAFEFQEQNEEIMSLAHELKLESLRKNQNHNKK